MPILPRIVSLSHEWIIFHFYWVINLVILLLLLKWRSKNTKQYRSLRKPVTFVFPSMTWVLMFPLTLSWETSGLSLFPSGSDNKCQYILFQEKSFSGWSIKEREQLLPIWKLYLLSFHFQTITFHVATMKMCFVQHHLQNWEVAISVPVVVEGGSLPPGTKYSSLELWRWYQQISS